MTAKAAKGTKGAKAVQAATDGGGDDDDDGGESNSEDGSSGAPGAGKPNGATGNKPASAARTWTKADAERARADKPATPAIAEHLGASEPLTELRARLEARVLALREDRKAVSMSAAERSELRIRRRQEKSARRKALKKAKGQGSSAQPKPLPTLPVRVRRVLAHARRRGRV